MIVRVLANKRIRIKQKIMCIEKGVQRVSILCSQRPSSSLRISTEDSFRDTRDDSSKTFSDNISSAELSMAAAAVWTLDETHCRTLTACQNENHIKWSWIKQSKHYSKQVAGTIWRTNVTLTLLPVSKLKIRDVKYIFQKIAQPWHLKANL